MIKLTDYGGGGLPYLIGLEQYGGEQVFHQAHYKMLKFYGPGDVKIISDYAESEFAENKHLYAVNLFDTTSNGELPEEDMCINIRIRTSDYHTPVTYPTGVDETGDVLYTTSNKPVTGIREVQCLITQETCRIGYIELSGQKMMVRAYRDGWTTEIGEIQV
jgi:hypothetical protein